MGLIGLEEARSQQLYFLALIKMTNPSCIKNFDNNTDMKALTLTQTKKNINNNTDNKTLTKTQALKTYSQLSILQER